MKKSIILALITLFISSNIIIAYDINKEKKLDAYSIQIANIVREELEINEALKVGGTENYKLIKQLYSSEEYKKQQTEGIEEILSSFSKYSKQDTDEKLSNIRKAVRDKINLIESQKAGGEYNYNLVKKIYTNPEYIKQQRTEINKAIENISKDTEEEQINFQTLTSSSLESLKKGTIFFGPINAKISILVFTDFECPFCKKLHNNKIMQNIQKKYKTTLNYAFKQFPISSIHPYANSGALAAECIGEQLGKTGLQTYIDKIMLTEISQEQDIKTIAYSTKINKDAFDKCYTSAKYQEKINKDINDGTTIFEINGTPSTIIINNKTLNRTMIPGAYSQKKFEEAINSIFKIKN